MAESETAVRNRAPPKEMSMEVAAAAGLPADGRGDVPDALLLQDRRRPPAKKTTQQTTAGAEHRRSAAPAAPAPPAASRAREPQRRSHGARSTPASRPLPTFVDRYRPVPRDLQQPGRTVRSWLLKKYKGNDGKPLDLVNHRRRGRRPFPSPSISRPASRWQEVNWAYYAQTPDADGLGVTYDLLRRPHRRAQDFPLPEGQLPVAGHERKLTLDGKPVPHMIQWRGGFGDLTVSNPPPPRRRCTSTWPTTS